jgi:hypothetical protein
VPGTTAEVIFHDKCVEIDIGAEFTSVRDLER